MYDKCNKILNELYLLISVGVVRYGMTLIIWINMTKSTLVHCHVFCFLGSVSEIVHFLPNKSPMWSLNCFPQLHKWLLEEGWHVLNELFKVHGHAPSLCFIKVLVVLIWESLLLTFNREPWFFWEMRPLRWFWYCFSQKVQYKFAH